MSGSDLNRRLQGIELHRPLINLPTATHCCPKQNRLRHKYHHYSGVIVDVFYDTFLHVMEYFYDNPLLILPHAYRIIQAHDSILPEDLKRIFLT